jgi:protein-L-isoaspartate(D-aspartate) O-methyltransferase
LATAALGAILRPLVKPEDCRMDDAARRRIMVENQLRPSNVTDPRVLEAMESVPRPPFLPAQLKGVAYSDDDITLPDGRFLIEPLVLARMLEVADCDGRGTALVVGCDTGYAAVVAARLAATVFALVDPERVEEVERRAAALDADNVFAVPGADPLGGHPAKAPYDAVLVVGRIPEIPDALTDQLAEGGRLVAVIGDGRMGRGTLVHRVHGHGGRRALFDAAIPPLRGLTPKVGFEF